MLPQDQISDIMFIAALYFVHNLVQHMVQVLKHHLEIIVHPLLWLHVHFEKESFRILDVWIQQKLNPLPKLSKKCHLRCWDYKSCFYIDGLIKIYVSLLVLTMCSVSHKNHDLKVHNNFKYFNTTAFLLQHNVVSRLDCGKIMWIGFNSMRKIIMKIKWLILGNP